MKNPPNLVTSIFLVLKSSGIFTISVWYMSNIYKATVLHLFNFQYNVYRQLKGGTNDKKWLN